MNKIKRIEKQGNGTLIVIKRKEQNLNNCLTISTNRKRRYGKAILANIK